MTRAFFISDAHLGLGPRDEEKLKERRLLSFLEHVRQHGTHLFVLGDLFDAWFEYRTVIPKGFHRVLTSLDAIAHSGTKVHYLAGNHDYWMGDYFRDYLGIEVHSQEFSSEIDGKKFYFHHGDGLARNDWGYRILKRIVRNRLIIWLYSWIHPDIGLQLAKFSSRKSRNYNSKKDYSRDDGMQRFAEQKITEGYDYVLMGHCHEPTSVTIGRGLYVNLGDWIAFFTYAEFSEGTLRLKKWEQGER